MRNTITAVLAFSALALAAPASAQLVNGLSGPNYTHDAPIGTKAGGAISTLQAPGEAAAIKGAIVNEMDAKNMRPTPVTVAVKSPAIKRQTTVARNDTSNDMVNARLRLERNSD